MTLTFQNVVGNLEVYMDVMRAICGQTYDHSMADLMCCTAPNTPKLGFSDRWYFDIVNRKLDHKEEQNRFYQKDVLTMTITDHFYDVTICSDGIEHLTRDDGLRLIDVMKSISHKQIIFTPLTDLFGMAKDGDTNPEAHRSLWHPDDFQGWCSIAFPNYHKEWNGGAFFTWRDWHESQSEKSMQYIKSILKTKHWANGIHE
jgi:hypothetical protein